MTSLFEKTCQELEQVSNPTARRLINSRITRAEQVAENIVAHAGAVPVCPKSLALMLDLIDTRLNDIESTLSQVESRIEQLSVNTSFIWH